MSTDAAGRQPLILVEIDYDFCELEYGVSPCAAALGVSGIRKCFNTRKTCQDPNNYTLGTRTLTFCEPHIDMPRGENWIPLLDSVSTNPTRINVGGGDQNTGPLGKRASITARFRDAPYHDILTDKYRAERITGTANEGSLGDEGTEPDTVPDASGNNNDGTNNGATVAVVDGRAGLEFDGVDDYVDFGDVIIDGLTSITVSFWIYPKSRGSSTSPNGHARDEHHALHKAGRNNDNLGVTISDGGTAFYLDDGATDSTLVGSTLSTSKWTHVSATYNGSDMVIYLDGAEDARQTVDIGALDDTANPLQAGGRSDVTDGYVDGFITDARIWNTARTQSEIQADMNKRLTGNEPGLVGYWPMRGKPYDPLERGTFWSKYRTRQPFYRNRRMRVREGYVGQAPEDMRTRHYFIDEFDGPDAGGRAVIKAKDVLKFADNDRAQWPERSPGVLVNDISETADSMRISGAGVSDYDPDLQGAGTVRLGDEVILWSTLTVDGDDIILSGLTRGAERTEADDHDADDNVQRCQRYINAPLLNILMNIMDAAEVPHDFIPLSTWQAEADRWLTDAVGTVLLTEPFGATDLLQELTEQFAFYIWWDDLAQEIRLRAIRPLDLVFDEAPIILDDERHIIADSFKISDMPKQRRSQIWTYFRQIDPTEDVEEQDNYRRVRVRVDGNAEQPEQYDERKRRMVFARFIRTNAQAAILNTRLLNRYRDTPSIYKFKLDAKDRALKTGDVVDLSARQLQDDTGAQASRRMQIISVEEVDPSHRQAYEAQTFEFVDRFAFFMANDAPNYTNASAEQRETGGFFVDDNTLQFADGTEPYRFV